MNNFSWMLVHFMFGQLLIVNLLLPIALFKYIMRKD